MTVPTYPEVVAAARAAHTAAVEEGREPWLTPAEIARHLPQHGTTPDHVLTAAVITEARAMQDRGAASVAAIAGELVIGIN